MASLAGYGFKTKEDHLNIKSVVNSVYYDASTLIMCGLDTKFKNYLWDGNIKKLTILEGQQLENRLF